MADVITRTPDEQASEILEQRRASLRYFNDNFYGEMAEIYRNINARVEPLMVKNEKGEEVEDTSRSNICVPDHFVMVRHGVARLTRNAPNLRLRGKNQKAANDASAQLMYQWDHGEAQKAFRKIVHSSKALGWGVGKNYYDVTKITRVFRRQTAQMNREELMRYVGAPDDEIKQAIQELGPDLSADESSAAISDHGDEVKLGTPTLLYEGPVLAGLFIGDFFPEPGFQALNDSGYWIENSVRDDDWLEYWTKQTSTDPDTDEEMPVIDPKKAQELLEIAGDRHYIDEKEISLRRQMREAIGVSDPRTAGKPIKPPRKRFMVDERHSIIDGHLCIEYVGEEGVYLGKQWYPYDTYGRSLYTDMVLIPDLLGGIGQSTPRVSRFLLQLRNSRINQTTDFLNNKLLPILKVLEGNNLTNNSLQRTNFARLLEVRNMGELEFQQDPAFPEEAFQDQAQYSRDIQTVEPAMQDFQPGSETTPMAGKLATTAVLQKQAADAVLADELNCMNQFVRETSELWLWMNQQAMTEKLEIPVGVYSRVDQLAKQAQKTSAISITGENGSPRVITVDPMDIQSEFQILPEEGSTLADDDSYRRNALQQGFILASQNPDVFNKRAFASKLAETIPGISAEEAIMPEPDQPQQQGPQVRINFSIAAKFEDLATDVQEAMLGMAGLPTQGTQLTSTVHHITEGVKKVGEAANAASEFTKPANSGGETGDPGSDGERTPNVRTPKGLKGT